MKSSCCLVCLVCFGVWTSAEDDGLSNPLTPLNLKNSDNINNQELVLEFAEPSIYLNQELVIPSLKEPEPDNQQQHTTATTSI